MLRSNQITSFFTRYGKAIVCKVLEVNESEVRYAEGFDGEGREHTSPISAIKLLNPTSTLPIIDEFGTAK